MKLKKLLIHNQSQRVLFFADLHYNHVNSITFDGRPFIDVDEMNEYILTELRKLKAGDIVFDLGDTFWNMAPYDILNVLNEIPQGVKIYKILGNHDKSGLYLSNSNSGLSIRDKYEGVYQSLDITVEYDNRNYLVSLDHFPKVSWNHKFRGSFMLHGHTHGNIDEFNNNSPDLRVDVGFSGNLSKENGSFIIGFEKIYEFFYKKANNTNQFDSYVMKNCSEL